MPSIREYLEQAKAKWAFESMQHIVGVVREDYLSGQVLKVRTGNLRSRIDSKLLPERDGFEFGTKVDYGIGWELGMKAHTVVPVRAKALMIPLAGGMRWIGRGGNRRPGNVIFRKRANIPAQAPRPFMRPALEREMPYLQRTADEAYQKAADLGIQNRLFKI